MLALLVTIEAVQKYLIHKWGSAVYMTDITCIPADKACKNA